MNRNIEQSPMFRAAVLEFLRVYIGEHGWAPSIREIAEATGLRSTSSVHWHLCQLHKCGLIVRAEGVSRAIRLTGEAA